MQDDMTTQEVIYTEMNTIEAEHLAELSDVIKRFTQLKQRPKKPGLLAR